MNTKILDFVKFKLASEYTPASDTTITIIAVSSIYTLALQRQGGNLSDFRLTLTEKTDVSKSLRVAISSVASETIVNGKKQYVLNVKESDASNLMVGVANDDDGTDNDANIIAGNLSGLNLTSFSTDSPVNVVVGSAEYNVLLTYFNQTTDTEAIIVGEAMDSTTLNISVSLHTDGKYYKYHKTNYPNLSGVLTIGQNLAIDATGSMKNLKGTSTGYTGLTNGAYVYAENTGLITETSSATTTLLGLARGATIVDHAVRVPNAIALTDLEITTGTSTDSGTVSPLQLATLVGGKIKTAFVMPNAGDFIGSTEVVTSDTTAYLQFIDLPFGIDVNKISLLTTGVTTPNTLDYVIYSEDGSSQLATHTTSNVTSGTFTETLSTTLSLSAGRYIFGFVPNGTINTTFRTSLLSNNISVVGDSVSGTLTVAAGTMPSTIDMSALTTNTNEFFKIRLDN